MHEMKSQTERIFNAWEIGERETGIEREREREREKLVETMNDYAVTTSV